MSKHIGSVMFQAGERARMQNEIARLQADNEALRARLTRISTEASRYLVSGPVAESAQECHLREDLKNALHIPNTQAWLLRQKAEAVEDAVKRYSDDAYNWHVSEPVCRSVGLRKYAQRLRAEADRIERGGSDV